MSAEIVLSSATGLSADIASGRWTCVQVMDAHLEAIERINPELNAIVGLLPRQELMVEAERADHDLANGNRRGWLHGIPYAFKDMEEVEGLPWTAGSLVFKDRRGQRDAPVVRRIRDAGAIIIGKTNTAEFGYGSQTYNSVWGTTRNPYNRRLTVGGSSGGAAAAVAARLLPVADGGDFMGSLRNPPAFNNVLGLRPTQGLLPDFGPIGNLSTLGPIARTSDDIAALLSTMSGTDVRVTRRPGQAVKVAWLGDMGGRLQLEPEVLALAEAALEDMRALGWSVRNFPEAFEWERIWDAFLSFRAWFSLERRQIAQDPELRAIVKPEAAWEFDQALSLSALRLAEAFQTKREWDACLERVFADVDLIVAPTTQVMPFDADLHWPKTINGVRMDTYHRWMEVVTPWTLSGRPSLNVPAGFDALGRPTGVQLIGNPFSESALLGMADAYISSKHFISRMPEVCSG